MSITYRVEFDRIGRNRDFKPVNLQVRDEEHLAEVVHGLARKHLRSSDYEVVCKGGQGLIYCGLRPGGSFTYLATD